MAHKTRAELHEQYTRRLERTRRWREEQGYDRTWWRLIDLYRGKHWAETTRSRSDLIAVNLAFSTINVIAPSVAVNHPKVVVSANDEGNSDRAAFVEAVVNHLWRHHDFRKPFRRAVKDFLIFGHGWVKTGWKFLEQETSLAEAERDLLMQQARMEVDEFAVESPDLAASLPTDDEINANLPETAMMVIEDQPFVERISPFDIFVDPEATCMDDARWIAQKIVRPLEEAQKDQRYKPSVRKRLDADAGVNLQYVSQYENERERVLDEDRVTIWEFYDIADNTMSVFSENSDGFLVDPVPMPYAYGQPFVMIRNYDIPDLFYPMGDLESIESLQLELDKTRSQLMNDRKRYARKYLYHERSFGPAGREALESDEDGRLVPVLDENKPLSDVVIPMPQTPISPEIYNYSNIIENDINTVSGVSEYARGAMPEITRTATEASIIADAQNARAADKLAIIEISISEIARRVIQLMQQFMTGDQMARVSMKGGESLWVPYSRDDILGEYDFAVEAGSTQPMNDTIRKQQAVSLLNAIAPLVGTVIDPAALAIHVLEEGFGIKDPQKFIMEQQPPPPPGEVPMEEEAALAGGPLPPGGPPVPEPPPGAGVPPAFAPTGGVPPELMAQLEGQMGLELPSLG
ncbi:head-tail connector protein [uncultured Mediterranean phage uvDeep-CGR2-AD7-C12]|nr:head-tail connector protein [uncultured Mediterranean phage uvDeep-CGR2-AD7-C12]